ncbi:hypothetical protein BBF96_15125 [Anoxybacter fermentans]|uniref:Uncharacterized protein n=1 Tax=Anoxybacter fermentans TaxID=1323375 RepID=A0A3S9T1Z9_9FIRM|nr:hypothetical protein [Anoxybacter fermentans]AZR74588.1 hypothetical protein BBF96_15125 [Anoxybacter fermentans]
MKYIKKPSLFKAAFFNIKEIIRRGGYRKYIIKCKKLILSDIEIFRLTILSRIEGEIRPHHRM